MEPVKKYNAIPGIERTPGVCGGDACITNTCIPVWVLERARQFGMSDDDLLRSYLKPVQIKPLCNQHCVARAWVRVASSARFPIYA